MIRDFFNDFLNAIKLRAVAVFLLVHVGLVAGVYALARASALGGWDQTAWFFLASILLLYFGFILGVFFIVWPLLPWVRRVRRIESWSQHLLHDLPLLLEQLPKIVAAVQAIAAAWKSATSPEPEKKESNPVTSK